jgi:hypothetical protein
MVFNTHHFSAFARGALIIGAKNEHDDYSLIVYTDGQISGIANMWLELSLIFIFCGSAFLWFDSIGARDIAIQYGRELSARTSLQLLDESVACSDFDVSANGGDRLHCELVLLGKQLVSWHIPPYPVRLH